MINKFCVKIMDWRSLSQSLESSDILTGELTKQRFLAICHYYLQKSKKAGDFVSPLVSRVCFDDANPLIGVKALLGGGLQFLGPVFEYLYEKEQCGSVLFLTACVLMDYIRITTPDKTADGKTTESVNALKYKNFLSYALSDDAADGDMLLAGSRNIGDTGLECIKKDLDFYLQKCALIKVGQFGGNSKDRVKSNYTRLVSSEQAKRYLDNEKSQGRLTFNDDL